MKKRIIGILLTLAMCMGLLPMTAWAAGTPTPTAGDVDIYTTIQGVDTTFNSVATGDEVSFGYKWEWDGTNTPKTLDITLEDGCNIAPGGTEDGNLILPDGCAITITLKGNAAIAGNIQFSQIDSSGSSKSYTLTIKSENPSVAGRLSVGSYEYNGIFASGANDDTLIITDGAEVITKSLSLGASGASDSYLEVTEGGKLTVTDNAVYLTELVVKSGAQVSLKKGLRVADTQHSDRQNYLPRIYMEDSTSQLELGAVDLAEAALKTVRFETRFQSALTNAVTNYLPNSGNGYEVKFLDMDGTYEVYQADSAVKYLLLGVPASDGGDSVTPPPASSGGSKSRWYDIEAIQPEGGEIIVASRAKRNVGVKVEVEAEEGYTCKGIIVTDAKDNVLKVIQLEDGRYQFTMPRRDVTVEAVMEKAETGTAQPAKEKYILLTIDQKKAWVFDQWKENDVPPVIRNERAMLPARFVAEALGATVTWDAAQQKVTITKDDTILEIFIGEPFAILNGAPVELDAAAFIENDRTYLPLRLIAESLGAEVIWNAAARTITIFPA